MNSLTLAKARLVLATTAPKRRSKYGNAKTIIEGVLHSSKKQGMRWVVLQQWQRMGEISGLRREVPYRLEVNGKLICKYIADHVYTQDGVEVVEDVKSPVTRKNRAYRIKFKLMKAIHGIEIREI